MEELPSFPPRAGGRGNRRPCSQWDSSHEPLGYSLATYLGDVFLGEEPEAATQFALPPATANIFAGDLCCDKR